MVLPTPNLDDRRFQDLVDEARMRVRQRCPQWTDHNVSDPGITLIEAFADMVEQLLYRVNRVPEVHYLRFLDLIGVRPFPPTAARCDVTFWLSAARPATVLVPAGNQVASERTEVEEPVIFTVERDLHIVPCTLTHLATSTANDADSAAAPVDRTDDLRGGKHPATFGTPPAPSDAVLFGLSAAMPGCAVLLRVDCPVQGHGINPDHPPWAWQAWDGTRWVACDLERDTTGGFNQPGDVVLHVPPTHTTSVLARRQAGWLRCVLITPAPGQPFYKESPKLYTVAASTIGGTTSAVHGEVVRDEIIGVSDGAPAQKFPLARTPVVGSTGSLVVEVSSEDGWQEWQEVSSFAQSERDDRHVNVDRVAGQIEFGPAIRQPDSTLRHYGAIPPKGASIRVPMYAAGGGARGNVAPGVLSVHRDPIPFVTEVTNRRAATGGVDGERVQDAAERGPLLLRNRDRAVTAEDYEHLARDAAPEVARVRCLPVEDQGAVRVLVVPAVSGGQLSFGALRLAPEMRDRIVRHLDQRRCIGARVSVEPPFYLGVTVVAQVRALPRVTADGLRTRAIEALNGYLDPIRGGPDGDGWPFGRPVQVGEVFAVLQCLRDVDLVEDVRLFRADPVTGDRSNNAEQRLDLGPNGLVFSFGHQVRVTRG